MLGVGRELGIFTIEGGGSTQATITPTIYDLYLAVTLIWQFGGVALQPPIIVSANRRLHCKACTQEQK